MIIWIIFVDIHNSWPDRIHQFSRHPATFITPWETSRLIFVCQNHKPIWSSEIGLVVQFIFKYPCFFFSIPCYGWKCWMMNTNAKILDSFLDCNVFTPACDNLSITETHWYLVRTVTWAPWHFTPRTNNPNPLKQRYKCLSVGTPFLIFSLSPPLCVSL